MGRTATIFADEVIERSEFETTHDPGPVTEETYRRVAMEDPERHWELHNGLLVEKPGMGVRHNDVMIYLGWFLLPQLDPVIYRPRVNSARLHLPTGRYYIPDLVVVPTEITLRLLDRENDLEIYEEPMPLVVELRSPSTSSYDANTKIPDYRRRGDLEIWRLQPFKHTLTIWTRQPDGQYQERDVTTGIVRLAHIPNVEIDLERLFDVRNR